MTGNRPVWPARLLLAIGGFVFVVGLLSMFGQLMAVGTWLLDREAYDSLPKAGPIEFFGAMSMWAATGAIAVHKARSDMRRWAEWPNTK